MKELVRCCVEGDFTIKVHKNRSLYLMLVIGEGLAKTLAALNIGILRAPTRTAFVTTDRPFVIMPPRDSSWIPRWAGVGIVTPGAQKYLPLSNDLAVVFGDPGRNLVYLKTPPLAVKMVNAAVGMMTDRFLLARDEALVRWWSKRLHLAETAKVVGLDLVRG